MDKDILRRVSIHAAATLHAITLAELAALHPDPDDYLRSLEGRVMPLLDAQETSAGFPEELKHGALQAIGGTFGKAKVWLDRSRAIPPQ